MTTAIEAVEQFLNGLTPKDAERAVEHLRHMIHGQGINVLEKFVESFDINDPIDGVIAATVAHIIAQADKSMREQVDAIRERTNHVCGSDLAAIMVNTLRHVSNGIENQMEQDKHTH
jgi:limonene-1,2-epoxide hydrolase